MTTDAHAITPRQSFWQGLRHGGPFVLIVGPFGVVFGVVATDAGLSLAQTMGFTIAVIAGAAQLTAVPEPGPAIVLPLAALAGAWITSRRRSRPSIARGRAARG